MMIEEDTQVVAPQKGIQMMDQQECSNLAVEDGAQMTGQLGDSIQVEDLQEDGVQLIGQLEDNIQVEDLHEDGVQLMSQLEHSIQVEDQQEVGGLMDG